MSVRGSEGGCGPPALAPANLAAQILPRASQKSAPHVLLSRTSCDTNQPCAPAQLHCCTTAVPHCSSSSGSLGLCLHACHTPAALSPASRQGSRHCLYSDPSTGDPPLPPPSLSTLVMEKLTYSPTGTGGSLRCLSCSEPAGGRGRIAHRSLFPPELGCVSNPETGVQALKCTALAAGVCSRGCFRIQCGTLFIGAGLLFHSSAPSGRCNSCTVPLSVFF